MRWSRSRAPRGHRPPTAERSSRKPATRGRVTATSACYARTIGRTITFLSDYGLADSYAGVCRGVLAARSPDSTIIDVTHGVYPHDVRTGALILRRTLPYFEPGVHLAVVDPGVGSSRLAIALRTVDEDRLLVGPDNGLLSLAAQRFGGVAEVVDVSRSPHRLDPVSHTFHGRDIFAPVAAALARGEPLAEAGEPLDAEELVRLEMPLALPVEPGALTAHAISFDHFGNVMLDVEHTELTGVGFRLGAPVSINGVDGVYTTAFVEVPPGELLLYEDAYRTLAVAVNRGSAQERLALQLDDVITIRLR